MFFRILHLACGLMIVLLGVKIYAIAGDLMDDTDSASSSLTAAAMAQPQPQPQPQAEAPAPVAPSAQPSKAAAPPPSSPAAASKMDDLCAHGGCKGPAPTAPVPTAQSTDPVLAEQLATREKELDRRDAALNDRQRLVDAAEEELQRRMTALENSRTALESSEQHTDQLRNDDADRLVKIYQAMKPEDAAAIFNILDLRVGVALLNKMNPRKASAIMEAMSPQRAILATQLLVNSHARPATRIGGNG
ncbi:MotE family protein [Gluconobacter roseus]|uniref:MotE family protein n=1 Tax=Gluconobacter roseus TaxID=586239 RepID=UPI0038D02FE0